MMDTFNNKPMVLLHGLYPSDLGRYGNNVKGFKPIDECCLEAIDL
jgi:hypothetical protein